MEVLLKMMSSPFPQTPTRPSSTFTCKFCKKVELYWSTIKSPKGVPLPLAVETRQFHDCPLSDYNIKRNGRLRANTVKSSAIRNIQDFAMVDEAQNYISHVNSRLGYHRLRLEVKQTRPLPEEWGH
jgi:hypothetical protein